MTWLSSCLVIPVAKPLDLDALKLIYTADPMDTPAVREADLTIQVLIAELEATRAELADASAAVDSEFARAERAEAAIARVEALEPKLRGLAWLLVLDALRGE